MRTRGVTGTTTGFALVSLLAVAALVLLVPGLAGFGLWAGEEGEKAPAARGAYLGVGIEEETKGAEGGARVVNVLPDSPAEKAGIEDGDVIVRFGGELIRGPMRLTQKIRASKPGEKIEVEVLRDGDRKKLTVELGERKERPRVMAWDGRHGYKLEGPGMENLEDHLKGLDESMPEIRKEILKHRIPGGGRAWVWNLGGRPKLGVELVQTTPDLREFFGGERDAGVLVGRVMKGSAAEKAGVKVGDLIVAVDGEKVEDAGDLVGALEDKDGKAVELEVIRDRRTIKVKAEIPAAKDEDEERVGPRARLAPPPPAPPAPARAPAPPSPRAAPSAPRPVKAQILEEVRNSLDVPEIALPEILAEVERAIETAHEAVAPAALERIGQAVEVSGAVLPEVLAEVERAIEGAQGAIAPEVLEKVRRALEEAAPLPECQDFDENEVTAL